MISMLCIVDRRVGPLVLIIKEWSKQCGINNAPAGYLSSYSVVLMAIFFLQCKSSDCEMTVTHLPCFVRKSGVLEIVTWQCVFGLVLDCMARCECWLLYGSVLVMWVVNEVNNNTWME